MVPRGDQLQHFESQLFVFRDVQLNPGSVSSGLDLELRAGSLRGEPALSVERPQNELRAEPDPTPCSEKSSVSSRRSGEAGS